MIRSNRFVPRVTTRTGMAAGLLVAVITPASISLTGCGNNLAKSARPIVTSIIAEQLGGGAECVDVKLGKEFAEDRYHATALLANGNEIKIVIHDRGDAVEVTIPSQ